jgi:hypothetical protein
MREFRRSTAVLACAVMKPWARTIAAVVVCGVLTAAARPLAAQPREPEWAREFPPLEQGQVATLTRIGWSMQADALRRTTPDDPAIVEALLRAGRGADALRTIRNVARTNPSRLADALSAVARYDINTGLREVPGQRERQLADLAALRAQWPRLDPATRSQAAYALMCAEERVGRPQLSATATQRLRRVTFMTEFAGTPGALLAEVDVISLEEARGNRLYTVDRLMAFADAHPGTVAAATALHAAGTRLGPFFSRSDGLGPAERADRVFDIIRRLEQGGFPPCEWTRRAVELTLNIWSTDMTSTERAYVLEAILDFAASHWALEYSNPARDGIGFTVTYWAEHACSTGDEAGRCVAAALTQLETRGVARADTQYLLAAWYTKWSREQAPANEQAARLAKAREVLTGLQTSASGLHARKALADLALLAYWNREFATAEPLLATYVSLYPDSTYAWLAALRRGQCLEILGRLADARQVYQQVSATGMFAPLARVLSGVYSARLALALHDPDGALREYRQALADWAPAMGEWVNVPSARRVPAGRPVPLVVQSGDELSLDTIKDTIARLEAVTAAPGAADTEAARWMADQGRWVEARDAAERVLTTSPASANVPQARVLAHTARLEMALALADTDTAAPDTEGAIRALRALDAEPFDTAIAVAMIARGFLLSSSGAKAEGEALLVSALDRWRGVDGPPAGTGHLSPTEQDVAAIRAAVFRPSGDGPFQGTRWNGFGWPQRPARVVVIDPAVSVRLADGSKRRLTVRAPMAGVDNVLYLDVTQQGPLRSLMTRLGGTRTRTGRIDVPHRLMETPTVPTGPSVDLSVFLNRAFAMRPGHWGGWIFTTFPVLEEVAFLDEGRTKAVAFVRVGYGGGYVPLEKRDGAWLASPAVRTWVE